MHARACAFGGIYDWKWFAALSTPYQAKMERKQRRPLSCFYCNEEGHIKRDCPKKQKEGTRADSKLVCYNCNEPGHSKRDCPLKREGRGATEAFLCYYCNEPGHSKRECPKRKDGGEMLCYHCNKPGHIKQDCPDRSGRGVTTMSSVVCFNCNQTGHFKRDCPALLASSSSSFSRAERGSTSNQLGSPRPEQQQQPSTMPAEKTSVASVAMPTPNEGSVWGLKSNGNLSPPSELPGSVGSRLSSQNPTEDNTHVPPTDDVKSKPRSGPTLDPKSEPGPNTRDADGRGTGGRGQRKPFPPFVDTHCHLEYVFERYEHQGTFSDFTRTWKYPANFDGCVASFCDPAAFSSFGIWLELLAEPGSKVWAAFGIHPHHAKYYLQPGLEDKLLRCLAHERCIALGEIGLDYGPRNTTTAASVASSSSSDPTTQRDVLTRQLKLAMVLKKPLVLHCRDAEQDLLEILSAHVPRDWRIHLHCYTGSHEMARKFTEQYPNLFLGVTGCVTYDRFPAVHRTVRSVPLERLLVETDAPYHMPRNLPRAERDRCKSSHPAHAHYVAKEIARLKGVELADVLSVLRENTRKMYGI